MAPHRFATVLGFATLIVAAFAALCVFRVPEMPRRAIAAPPANATTAHRTLPPSSTPPPTPPESFSTTDSDERIEFAKEEPDEEAALESALLTLIRARGRGTDARR